MPGARRTVAGVAMESDTLAHVLYRADPPAGDPRRPIRIAGGDRAPWAVDVLTFIRRRGEWRALLNGDLVWSSLTLLDRMADERR